MKMSRVVRVVLPPLIPLVIFIVVAELAVQRGWVREFLVPAPSKVFATLTGAKDRPELARALWQTTVASVAGFALSAITGVLAGVVLSSAGWVQRAFYPYAIFFQTVPIIAIAPLLVIWLGFGLPTIIASAFIVSIFPVIANTLNGLLSVDPNLRDLFRLYGAGGLARLFKLQIPAAMPAILTGFRIAAGLAVIGAIVGEFIAGGGLGGVIDISRTQQRVDKVFAAMLLASVLGLALFSLINLASRLALRHWHASESEA